MRKILLEKLVATRMPSLTSRALCFKKHSEAIDLLLDGITRWLIRLEDRFGPEILEVIREIQFEVGRETGERMKKEYKLGDEIADALNLMWMLIVPFGIKMKAERIGEGHIREEKSACPIFDVFRRHGVNYCDELCISLGNGWLNAINPNLKFELVRRGDKDHYCIKDIVDTAR